VYRPSDAEATARSPAILFRNHRARGSIARREAREEEERERVETQ
jgi:hypothetical protein